MRREILTTLTGLNACTDAKEWVLSLNDDVSNEAAWTACERGDWMVWLIGALHRRDAITRQVLTLATVACTRTALPRLAGRPAESAVSALLDATERWCRGEADMPVVKDARDAVYRARDEAWKAYQAARRIYWDAIDRRNAAAAAAYAAAAAAYAADAAADAYADAAAADAYATAAAYAYAYAAAYAAADAAAYATNAAYWAARSAALRAHRAGICRLIRAAVPCPL